VRPRLQLNSGLGRLTHLNCNIMRSRPYIPPGRPWVPRSLPETVATAYAAWRGADRPFENFRGGSSAAPTYGVELDLDHQASYLIGMHDMFIAGSPHWDFLARADEELTDLHEFMARLNAVGSSEHVDRLRIYIGLTDQLLRTFLSTLKNQTSAAVSIPPAP
jgi:hypothetical protein